MNTQELLNKYRTYNELINDKEATNEIADQWYSAKKQQVMVNLFGGFSTNASDMIGNLISSTRENFEIEKHAAITRWMDGLMHSVKHKNYDRLIEEAPRLIILAGVNYDDYN